MILKNTADGATGGGNNFYAAAGVDLMNNNNDDWSMMDAGDKHEAEIDIDEPITITPPNSTTALLAAQSTSSGDGGHRRSSETSQASSTTTTDAAVQEMTSLFAKQNLHDVPREKLQSVNLEERMESLQDVHGVLEVVKESPELVQAKLHELTAALRQQQPSILAEHAFDIHKLLDVPGVITSQLIRFLRADAFDVSKSMVRVIKHYRMKWDFFGTDDAAAAAAASSSAAMRSSREEFLARNLRLSDLNDIDRRALEDGAVQLYKKRDRSGRAIIAMFSNLHWDYPAEVISKILFWSATIASRDENVQRKGVIVIHFGMDKPLDDVQMQRAVIRGPMFVATFPCMPLRVSASHATTNYTDGLLRVSQTTHHLDSKHLCRFLSHFGNNRECRYNLMTFGIPLDVHPVREQDGCVDLTSHHAWLKSMERQEEKEEEQQRQQQHLIMPTTTTSSSCSTRDLACISPLETQQLQTSPSSDDGGFIIHPGNLDVIMGKGRRGLHSPGNHLLKRYLEQYQDQYDCSLRFEKAMILEKIYKEMRQQGCRFLAPKQENNKSKKGSGGGGGGGGGGSVSSASSSPSGGNTNDLWFVVSETEALNRISHGFRNRRQATKRS